MSTDNTEFVDQFRFETKEDGTVIAEDQEGYVINFDIGDIDKKETFDDASIEANWEEVICPIVHNKIYQNEDDENKESVSIDQLAVEMDEFTNELVEILESDDFDTSNIRDELDTEALDRHAKAITEYLIHTEILEKKDSKIQILNLSGVKESGMLGADDAVVNKIIKWSGTLELVIDNLKEKREIIEEQFDVLESRLEENRKDVEELKEKLKQAREELYDICDGRQLEPKEIAPDGQAEEAPDELDSEVEKTRYKDKYNKIVRLKGMIPKEGGQVGPAVNKLDNVRRMFKDREDELEFLVKQLRRKAYQAENTKEIDGYEELMATTSDVISKFSKSLEHFSKTADEVNEKVSTSEVFGNEVDDEAINDIEDTARAGLNESESAYDEAKDKLEETNEQLGEPEPQNR